MGRMHYMPPHAAAHAAAGSMQPEAKVGVTRTIPTSATRDGPRGAMSFPVESRLQRTLASRASRGLLRTLTHADGLADFSSNDYLGLAHPPPALPPPKAEEAALRGGSTGSRLLTGNSRLAEEIER